MHLLTLWGDNTLRLSSNSAAGSTAYLKIQNPEQDIIFQRPYPWLHFLLNHTILKMPMNFLIRQANGI